MTCFEQASQSKDSTNPSTCSSALVLKHGTDAQVFTTAGIFNGNTVAIKSINKPYIYLTRAVIQEMNEVRSGHYLVN